MSCRRRLVLCVLPLMEGGERKMKVEEEDDEEDEEVEVKIQDICIK